MDEVNGPSHHFPSIITPCDLVVALWWARYFFSDYQNLATSRIGLVRNRNELGFVDERFLIR
jgi:hypothetical protein